MNGYYMTTIIIANPSKDNSYCYNYRDTSVQVQQFFLLNTLLIKHFFKTDNNYVSKLAIINKELSVCVLVKIASSSNKRIVKVQRRIN